MKCSKSKVKKPNSHILNKEDLEKVYDYLWELKCIQAYKQHTTLINMQYLEDLQQIITKVNLEKEAINEVQQMRVK